MVEALDLVKKMNYSTMIPRFDGCVLSYTIIPPSFIFCPAAQTIHAPPPPLAMKCSKGAHDFIALDSILGTIHVCI